MAVCGELSSEATGVYLKLIAMSDGLENNFWNRSKQGENGEAFA